MTRFTNKNVIVTGAAAGVGHPLAGVSSRGRRAFFGCVSRQLNALFFFYQRQVLNRARFFTIGCERLCDRARHP